ncbi:hypothetical protein B5X24_HaOG216993 [Helicoverpa armigera]|uniref:Uncharacterized protein n=1 Tax=Helicoverpa armigera TaxID=29058 RepID=A0A2W1BVD0_HELAM|nr:hypothetical protein B5X24_HaOG216993 [Helicoverpa armigera]
MSLSVEWSACQPGLWARAHGSEPRDTPVRRRTARPPPAAHPRTLAHQPMDYDRPSELTLYFIITSLAPPKTHATIIERILRA